MDYKAQLRHPMWQRRRLERLSAAGWRCTECSNDEAELHVHHERYLRGRMAWEYPDELLAVLCDTCHEKRHGKEPSRPTRVWRPVGNTSPTLLDRAVWLLVYRSDLWLGLGDDAHDLLAAQAAPYNLFFGCIERTVLQHGPLAAAVMLDELRDASTDDIGRSALDRITAFHRPPTDADLAAELDAAVARIRLHAVQEELKIIFNIRGEHSPDTQARAGELLREQQILKARQG